MFCDRCGATVPPDQRFCGRCGKELSGAFTPVVYPSTNRVQQHIRLLGILWLAFSALSAVGGLGLFIVGNTIFGHMSRLGGPQGFPPFLSPLLSVIAGAVLLKAALGFIAGWGLLRHESWARILTIVLSFFALFNVPLGTALGIYGLWVLLPASSEREYEQAAKRADAA